MGLWIEYHWSGFADRVSRVGLLIGYQWSGFADIGYQRSGFADRIPAEWVCR